MGDLLKRGDIIEIKGGHKVYAKVPKHHCFSNCKGVWELTEHSVNVDGVFDYLAGKYIVYHASIEGGGKNFDGPFPDGHRVFCRKILPLGRRGYASIEHEINFYQTGCFTAMIEDITPVDHANLKITIDEE